jgi:tetratricopeptide (TPR) repeat protein
MDSSLAVGLQFHRGGQLEEAARCYRELLARSPDDADALHLLGLVVHQQGQTHLALDLLGRAVAVSPKHVGAHLNLAQLLLDQGRANAALAHLQEMVRLRPDLAIAQTQLGLLLRQQGEPEEAEPFLLQATALEPNSPAAWKNLAELYADREEFAAALPCWERVVALDPSRAAPRLGLAWALQEMGRIEEAERHLRSALEQHPDSAAAHLSLGSLHEQQGDPGAAAAAYRTALKLQPSLTPARVRLALLLRGQLPDADRAALEEQADDPQRSAETRAGLLLALAQVLDAQGNHAAAAARAGQGHALSREQARRRGTDYDPAAYQRFVDSFLDAFTPDFFARTADAGLPTRQPVFIVGLPRSGTTLVEQILASHSRVHGAGELRLARQTFRAIPAALGGGGDALDHLAALDGPAVRRLAEQHLARLTALGGSADRVVDKMPDNYQYLGLLAALFPEATFIHCRRDLRDVAVSCWLTDFRWQPWTHDFEHIATRFAQYDRLMAHWSGVLPVTLCVVDYETLVSDPEPTVRRVLAACGLEWEPACLEFHRARRPVRTPSAPQVRRPLYQASVGRWLYYQKELGGLFQRLSALPGNEHARR